MPNYDYINARISSMTRHRLDRTVYDDLIAAGSLERLTERLQETAYGPAVTAALAAGSGPIAIERGLMDQLSQTFRKLESFMPGAEGALISRLLRRWDLHNIKTLIRARHAERPVDEPLDLIPAGPLGPAALAELAAADGLRPLLDRMATWGLSFARPLRAALPAYEASHDLASLEAALHRAYFAEAFASLEGEDDDRLVRDTLAMEVDVLNIVMALQAIKHRTKQEDAHSRFIPGGLLSRRFLHELLEARDLLDAVTLLELTLFAPAVERGILHFGQASRISVLERRLEGVLIRRAKKRARSGPQSIGPAIAYIWTQYNEFVNLRLLVRCTAHGVPQGAMREELIIV